VMVTMMMMEAAAIVWTTVQLLSKRCQKPIKKQTLEQQNKSTYSS
jgi:hypothetical protein